MPEAGTGHITHMAERRQRTHAPSAIVVVTTLSFDEQDRTFQLCRQRELGLYQLGHAELVGVFLESSAPTPNFPYFLVCPRLLQVMNEQDHQSVRQ